MIFRTTATVLVALGAFAPACAAATTLTDGMQAVHDFERHRQLLDAPLLSRVAYFRPGDGDWTLLVTEHEGATDLRGILAARGRFAERWDYLDVGPARGIELQGVRALTWRVGIAADAAGPPVQVAVLALDDRTRVLELRGGSAEALAAYRHPRAEGLPLIPAVLAVVIVTGGAWLVRRRRDRAPA